MFLFPLVYSFPSDFLYIAVAAIVAEGKVLARVAAYNWYAHWMNSLFFHGREGQRSQESEKGMVKSKEKVKREVQGICARPVGS